MKNKNSTSNMILAIILLIVSIVSLLITLGTYAALLFITFLNQVRYIAFSHWDYTLWAIAWTILHSYMIILCIEWLKEKSVKHDMINTLTLFLIAGIWGLIRVNKPGILEILMFIFYAPILYYFYRTPTEKLSTKY